MQVNRAPSVSSAINDATFVNESGTHQVSLSGVFSDADNDSLTITAQSSDDAKATVSVASDQSSLTVTAKSKGTAVITVSADDGNGSMVQEAFTVTVKAAPTVVWAISDVTGLEESATQDVSLRSVFNDADGDTLTITAESSDETKAAVSVGMDRSDDGETIVYRFTLELTLTGVSEGTVTITVTAEDSDGNTVSDTFDVEVVAAPQTQQAAPNRAPTVSSAISDATIVKENGTSQVSLSGVFDDADGDTLTITAKSSDDTKATVTVASDGSKLTLAGVAEGTVTITVTAEDSDGNTVSDAFEVTVGATGSGDNAQQSEPYSPYADLIAKIKEWRNDPRYVHDQNHTGRWDRTLLAFGETVDDQTLTPMSADEAQGYADRGSGWERWVEVAKALKEIESAGQPNQAPTVSTAIADLTIVNESGTSQVSLSGVFADADNDSLTITASSSDETKATVSVAADGSSLTVSAQSRGTATITVTADDGRGGTVDDDFAVTVKAAPVVASAISDVSGLEVGWQDISLSGVFSDADGDTLTFTALSSDDTTVSAFLLHDTLSLFAIEVGSATITVTAEDSDGNTASDTFDVEVVKKYADLIAKMKEWRNDPCCAGDQAHTDRWDRALLAFGETVADTTLTKMTADEAQDYADRGWERWVPVTAALREIESDGQPNQAPTVSAAIGDVTIVNESGTHQVSLSGVFSDADNDSLTVTAASSNEAVATAPVASDGSSLTVNAQARGTATITVTADDGNAGTVDDDFTVTVKAAPVVASAISDRNRPGGRLHAGRVTVGSVQRRRRRQPDHRRQVLG